MTVAIDADSANIAGVRFTEQAGDLAAPSAGGWKLYFKSGGLFYRETGGTVTQLAGDPTTTEGDLLYRHSGALARLGVGTNGQVLASNGTDPGWAAPTSTFAGIVTGTAFSALGIGGATAGMRIVGATTSGAPAAGTYVLGDTILDITAARWWVCTTAGTPGTWTPVSGFTNPMTTAGDLILATTAGAPTRIAKGADSTVLTIDPTTHLPLWAAPAAGFTNPLTTRGDLLVEVAGPAAGRLALGAAGQRLRSDGTDPGWADDIIDINYVIDGGGSVLTTGLKGYVQINQALTIVAVTSLADQSGSVVVDVFKCTYAAFDVTTHPLVADKITASAPPTIATAVKATDSTLTGWTTAIMAGDVLAFNVNSATTVQRVTINLKCKKAA